MIEIAIIGCDTDLLPRRIDIYDMQVYEAGKKAAKAPFSWVEICCCESENEV